jgi:hypothetical protein
LDERIHIGFAGNIYGLGKTLTAHVSNGAATGLKGGNFPWRGKHRGKRCIGTSLS